MASARCSTWSSRQPASFKSLTAYKEARGAAVRPTGAGLSARLGHGAGAQYNGLHQCDYGTGPLRPTTPVPVRAARRRIGRRWSSSARSSAYVQTPTGRVDGSRDLYLKKDKIDKTERFNRRELPRLFHPNGNTRCRRCRREPLGQTTARSRNTRASRSGFKFTDTIISASRALHERQEGRSRERSGRRHGRSLCADRSTAERNDRSLCPPHAGGRGRDTRRLLHASRRTSDLLRRHGLRTDYSESWSEVTPQRPSTGRRPTICSCTSRRESFKGGGLTTHAGERPQVIDSVRSGGSDNYEPGREEGPARRPHAPERRRVR